MTHRLPNDLSRTELGYLTSVTSDVQTQLNAKAASSHTHAQSDVTNLVTDLAAKAALASPTFTGTVTLPTTTFSGTPTLTGVTAANNVSLFDTSTGDISLGALSDDVTIGNNSDPYGPSIHLVAERIVSSTTTTYLTMSSLRNIDLSTAVSATSDIDIGTSGTNSGYTKTINFGTGGAAGSTTTITIGSANGTTTTFNGTLVLPSATSIGTITSTELGYLDGVTSSIQTQFGAKADLAGPTFTGTVTLPSTTSIGSVSDTEIGYLDGVTSSIQTQLGARLALTGGTMTGTITAVAPTTSLASINLPHGVDPTVPTNGDVWTTTAGMYVRINGVTVGPLGTSGGGGGTWGTIAGTLASQTDLQSALDLKSTIASPTFTGTVTVPTLDLTTAATATAATSYFVETGSDGVVRPKLLADVKTELVNTTTVNAAAATTVGTVTSGTWNATAINATYIDAAIARLASPTFTGTVTLPTLVGTSTTDSSSSTTGAFKTAGGMGIAKKLYVGTDAVIATSLTVDSIKIWRGTGGVSTNIGIGPSSLHGTSTGADNTGVGYLSLFALTTADNSTAVGSGALDSVTTGSSNTAVGKNAATRVSTTVGNAAFGASAMYQNNGSYNVALGAYSLNALATSSYNTAVGSLALQQATGSNNVALGSAAGEYETGANSLYIDSIERYSESQGKTDSLIYGQFHATPSSQQLTINGQLNATYDVNVGGALNATGTVTASDVRAISDVMGVF